MRIIVWRERNSVPTWTPDKCVTRGHGPEHGYKARDLVQFGWREYVCINTHQRAIFEPPKSCLWAEVSR